MFSSLSVQVVMHARDGDEASCCRLLLPPGDRVVPSRRRRRPPMTRLSAAGTSPPRRSRDLYLATSLPGNVMLSRHWTSSLCQSQSLRDIIDARLLSRTWPFSSRSSSSRSRRSPVGAPLPGARTLSSCRSATTPLVHRAGLVMPSVRDVYSLPSRCETLTCHALCP